MHRTKLHLQQQNKPSRIENGFEIEQLYNELKIFNLMRNLENYGVFELNQNEIYSIDGGGKVKTLVKIAKWAWNAIGIADALDDIAEGYNEVCPENC